MKKIFYLSLTALFPLSLFNCLSASQIIKPETKLKSVKLKKTNYQISLPKNHNLKYKKGVDYLFYSINKKLKKGPSKFMGGIYLGYYPKTFYADQSTDLVAVDVITILDDSVKFKIFKLKGQFYIEGKLYEKHYRIPTLLHHDKNLQIHLYGMTDDLNEIAIFKKIFNSLIYKE